MLADYIIVMAVFACASRSPSLYIAPCLNRIQWKIVVQLEKHSVRCNGDGGGGDGGGGDGYIFCLFVGAEL